MNNNKACTAVSPILSRLSDRLCRENKICMWCFPKRRFSALLINKHRAMLQIDMIVYDTGKKMYYKNKLLAMEAAANMYFAEVVLRENRYARNLLTKAIKHLGIPQQCIDYSLLDTTLSTASYDQLHAYIAMMQQTTTTTSHTEAPRTPSKRARNSTNGSRRHSRRLSTKVAP